MATVCENLISTKTKAESDISSLSTSLSSAKTSVLDYVNVFRNNYGKYNCGEDLDMQVSGITSSWLDTGNPIQLDSGKCKGGSVNCSKDGCIETVNNFNKSLSSYFSIRTNLNNAKSSLATTNAAIAINGGCIAESVAATSQKTGRAILYIGIGVILLVIAILLYRRFRKK